MGEVSSDSVLGENPRAMQKGEELLLGKQADKQSSLSLLTRLGKQGVESDTMRLTDISPLDSDR